jgi:uncharacterized protein (DUF2267 family)
VDVVDRPDRQVRRMHETQFLGEVGRMAGIDKELESERAVIAVFGALQDALGSATGTTAPRDMSWANFLSI